MKKRKVALAVGLSLAIGICGASLVACGGDDSGKEPGKTPGGTPVATEVKSEYYLAGTSPTSSLFSSALGDWNNGAKTVEDIPDSIAFYKSTTNNVYVLTADFFVGDEFGVLIAGQGWDGQMGTNVLSPAPTETTDIGEGGGYDIKNIKVNKEGNYTFILTVGKSGNKLTYVRNGNPDPVTVQYNYWVKGEKISGGAAKYNALTQLKTDKDQTEYTVTVNLAAQEKISILGASVTAGNSGTAIDEVTLKEGAAITALTGDADGYQFQAGEAGAYTITITEDDVVDREANKVTTKREVNATKAAALEYEIKIRSTAGDGYMDQKEYDFELKGDKYEYKFTAAASKPQTQTDIKDIAVKDSFKISVVGKDGTSIGSNAKVLYDLVLKDGFLAGWSELSPNINYQNTQYTILAAGEYTISIDATTFEVTVTSEQDEVPSYTVYAHGAYGGKSDWGAHEVTGVVSSGNSYTTTLTLSLKAGDEFGFKTHYTADHAMLGDQLDWASSNGSNIIAGKLEGVNADKTGNFKVLADGTYKFTIVAGEDGKFVSVTVEEVQAPAA
ncbi:MAG: DUF4397 domain-containing protein [Clostridiales bacterium]|nr:DUF4397 domain-containing protein [Clostridiales bacterium]